MGPEAKAKSEKMPTDAEEASAALRFIGAFDRLRKLAGNPSIDMLLKHVPGVPRATLHNAISGTRKSLADWPIFGPLIRLCIDISRDHGIGNVGTEDEWLDYWRAAIDGIIIPSPLESVETREKARKAEERAKVLSGTGVIQTLRAIYPNYPPVELWGIRHPICEFPAMSSEWKNPESAVGELFDGRVPREDEYSTDFDPGGGADAFAAYVERFRKASAEDRRHFFPGATYALHQMRFDSQGRVAIDCAMGRYFTSLATSEDLDTEMMEAVAASSGRAVALSDLPRRSWLHRYVGDPVVDGQRRAAAVSHATVVMSAVKGGGYDIILPVRSRDVATHANFNHVAPSGIFAPYDETSPSPEREFSVRRNFYREWVEELYAVEEHEHPAYSVVIPDPEDEPEIIRLKGLLSSKQGHLKYTGVSFNLLTMRPEICLALLIDDPEWFREEDRIARGTGRPFKLGWEYEQSVWEGPKVSGRPGQLRIPLNADLQPTDGSLLRPSFLIPNAAAVISLAIKMLKSQVQPQ